MGTIPCGLGTSTNARGLYLVPSSNPGFQPTSQIWTGQCGGDGTMTDPYPHPQHMKVVKHLSYARSGRKSIQHGFGASITAQTLHSASSSNPGFQTTQMWWERHDDGSISPSTAYEGCQTPSICLKRMCKPFHVGLEPPPMHKGIILCQAVTEDISQGLPKSGLTCVVGMA